MGGGGGGREYRRKWFRARLQRVKRNLFTLSKYTVPRGILAGTHKF
jgi:hypothetical protein